MELDNVEGRTYVLCFLGMTLGINNLEVACTV